VAGSRGRLFTHYGGWPIVVQKKFRDALAYHIAGVFGMIRVDETVVHEYQIRPTRFSTAPGAKRYYWEKGYL
jgi:hypothetical protein